jgi:hypothetical protein
MRYDTVGDWYYDSEGTLIIEVCQTYIRDYNYLIAVHELVEAILCSVNGISQSLVDDWDFKHPSNSPGSLPGCPYKKEHDIATLIEKLLCWAMGRSWENYGNFVDRMIIMIRDPDLKKEGLVRE